MKYVSTTTVAVESIRELQVFLTKRPKQGHKFFRSLGIILGIRLKVFQANWRL